MENQRTIKNRAKCVYRTRELFKGTYVSEFLDREEFNEKYASNLFKISEVHFDPDFYELSICLQKSNGSSLPYCICGESAVRQFMSDVVRYSLDKRNSLDYMKTENMIGKEIEVFAVGEVITGISPYYPTNKRVVSPNLAEILKDYADKNKKNYQEMKKKTQNKNLVAYTGDDICDRREFVCDKFYSRRLKIRRVGINPSNIILYINSPNGQTCIYQLNYEPIIRQFYSDFECYDILAKPKGKFTKRIQSLDDKELEVFFSKNRKVPVAISPIFK